MLLCNGNVNKYKSRFLERRRSLCFDILQSEIMKKLDNTRKQMHNILAKSRYWSQ